MKAILISARPIHSYNSNIQRKQYGVWPNTTTILIYKNLVIAVYSIDENINKHFPINHWYYASWQLTLIQLRFSAGNDQTSADIHGNKLPKWIYCRVGGRRVDRWGIMGN